MQNTSKQLDTIRRALIIGILSGATLSQFNSSIQITKRKQTAPVPAPISLPDDGFNLGCSGYTGSGVQL